MKAPKGFKIESSPKYVVKKGDKVRHNLPGEKWEWADGCIGLTGKVMAADSPWLVAVKIKK